MLSQIPFHFPIVILHQSFVQSHPRDCGPDKSGQSRWTGWGLTYQFIESIYILTPAMTLLNNTKALKEFLL